MSEFGDRVRRMLSERGVSQAELARLVGVKQQTINYLVSPESPAQTSRYATAIAQALGVSPVWLTTGVGEPTDLTFAVKVGNKTVQAAQIPVVQAAAVPVYLSGAGTEHKAFVMTDRITEESGFALEIDGDSMAPKFAHGDIVVIDSTIKPEPGDYVCALLKAGLVTFRRYRGRGTGFVLLPENQDWDEITHDDVHSIVGVMVEHRSFRRRRE